MGKKTLIQKPLGSLYIVSTPIGNLEDLTFRALRVLMEVPLIACEDTRRTLKLLNKYGIKKKFISYYQPKENQKIPQIIAVLKDGKDVALVSDAGTPGISDPGFKLIQGAINSGIKIIPVPGPTALTTALAASGLPTYRVLFIGFPPPKKEATKKMLFSLKSEQGTLVFYIPSRKITNFLQCILEVLGNRKIVIAREMTKIYEEFIRGEVKELILKLENIQFRGEITLLVQGKK